MSNRARARWTAVLQAPLWLAWAAAALAAPSLDLRIAQQPLHPGVPIEILLEGRGFDREPEPGCDVDPPRSGRLEWTGIVPNFSSSVRIVNGRIFKSETAIFTCRYVFEADVPGRHRIGPFRMSQGTREARAQARVLELREVPIDARVGVQLGLPEQSVYLGQQVPLAIEWWLDAELADRIRSYSIRAEIFDRDDLFRFVGDQTPASGAQSLELETAGGRIALAARVEERRRDGRDFLVVVAHRSMIPLRSGDFSLTPARIDVEEVTRWQRDLFGGRRPASVRRIFSRDEPKRLHVKAPPEEGRPASFGGAVGRGFSLEASTDRSVVQVGDPITLTLRVRGDGNLESVGPPALASDSGLDPHDFRIPDDDVAGELVDGAKVFRIAIRVLDEEVREIPGIAYAWFDPELGQYHTTHSRPIALSVRAARVISADDVVDAAPNAPAGAQSEAHSEVGDENPRTARATRSSRHPLSTTGADLAIERDPERLLHTATAGGALEWACYAGSLLIVLAAALARRRADVDPALRRRRDVWKRQRRRIEAAAAMSEQEALAEIAAALREAQALTRRAPSRELEQFLQSCDAVIYSPGAPRGEPIDARRIALATQLLDAMPETGE